VIVTGDIILATARSLIYLTQDGDMHYQVVDQIDDFSDVQAMRLTENGSHAIVIQNVETSTGIFAGVLSKIHIHESSMSRCSTWTSDQVLADITIDNRENEIYVLDQMVSGSAD